MGPVFATDVFSRRRTNESPGMPGRRSDAALENSKVAPPPDGASC
jgi:hypothetical protein